MPSNADEIAACPQCDSPQVFSTNAAPGGFEPRAGWYCKDCGAAFDEPTRRPRKGSNNAGAKRGLARALEDMDAEEVTGGGG